MTNETPIEEQEWRGGVTVVHIEDLRIARGLTRRPKSSCAHLQLVYDPRERRVWCKDCESEVDPFDAFEAMATRLHEHAENVRAREARLREAEEHALVSVASKEMDKAWRSRNMVPACPHCYNGLFPEDFKMSPAMLSKEYAKARLAKKDGQQ